MVSGFNHIEITVTGNSLPDDVKSKLTQFIKNNKPLYVDMTVENIFRFVGIATRTEEVGNNAFAYTIVGINRVYCIGYTEDYGWVLNYMDIGG